MPLNRLIVLENTLRAAGIPVDGISNNGPPYPAGVTVQYNPSATVEQIQQGNQIVETFDYRPRRSLTRQQIVSGLQALTTAQQNMILRQAVVLLLRERPQEVEEILTDTGIPLAVEEVDPT